MYACPKCHDRLVRAATPFGVVFHCRRCKGRMVGLATIRHDSVSQRFLSAVWQTARYHKSPGGRPCPHCDLPMRLARMSAGGRNLELDVCLHCQCIWFDPAEYGQMPRETAPRPSQEPVGTPPVARQLSPKAREAAAMLDLERIKLRQRREDTFDGGAPKQGWKVLPAILGMPVEVDAPTLSAQPTATWGLTGFLVAVFLLTGMGSAASVKGYGFIPAHWDRLGGFTLFSSFFLHGGWLHLIGNLYFLLVFGDNVEDRLGKWKFLVLALFSHLAGLGLHAGLEPRGEVPLVGASGGIFGLVACYALLFPKARMAFFLRFMWVRVPAWGMLVFFLLLQLVGAYSQMNGFGSVSSLGHLGGIAVGAAAALLYRIYSGAGDQDNWHKQERGRAA